MPQPRIKFLLSSCPPLAKHYAEVSPSGTANPAAEHGNYQGKNERDDLAGVGYGSDPERIQETALSAAERARTLSRSTQAVFPPPPADPSPAAKGVQEPTTG
jgi:hypothetical protein